MFPFTRVPFWVPLFDPQPYGLFSGFPAAPTSGSAAVRQAAFHLTSHPALEDGALDPSPCEPILGVLDFKTPPPGARIFPGSSSCRTSKEISDMENVRSQGRSSHLSLGDISLSATAWLCYGFEARLSLPCEKKEGP